MTRDYLAPLLTALARRREADEGRAVVAEAEGVARDAALRPLEGPRSDERGEVAPNTTDGIPGPQRAKNEGKA